MTRILFVGEGTVTDNVRCKLPAMHLAKHNIETAYLELRYRDQSPPPDQSFNAVVFSRPHHDSLMLSYKRLGIPVIVDMDDDFHAIPESHPGYKYVGEGDPYYLNKLDNCIWLADKLTVATDVLKERLSPQNHNCVTIPNGWSADNFNWMVKRSIHTDKFIMGWGGTITHRLDFKQCITPIKALLKDYPQTMICIVGDPEIYAYFANVPETQKLFVPMVDYYLYPIALSLWDVLLAPLENSFFNNAKSDIKLVDAGAKGIPFVASDIPVYKDWNKGGFLVGQTGWYDAIARLIEDKGLYAKISKEAQEAAKPREMSILVEGWLKTIEEFTNVAQEESPHDIPKERANGLSISIKGTNQDSNRRLPNRGNKRGNQAASRTKKAKAKAK